MTRPKVEDDKRKRTAQACDSCKRRKQKCNGLYPCNTCTKRHLSCTYLTSHHGATTTSPELPETKRRKVADPDSETDQPTSATADPTFAGSLRSPNGPDSSSAYLDAVSSRYLKPADTTRQQDETYGNACSEGEEEAERQPIIRMLLDPEGRLVYVGDTATLSFLQRIRMIVEMTKGSSLFTQDPARHFLTENALSLPPPMKTTHVLPERQTCLLLVTSFFENIHIFQVFDETSFLEDLDAYYADPLSMEQSWLCLLNLVLAIGLVLATPAPDTPEAHLIGNLRRKEPNQSDVFYHNAKHLNDPVAAFENADFWSVQALMLVSTYMLCRSKRNAAYTYLGMAVRSAYSLGLHREEALVIFSPAERGLRRQVWRSLFILDRFLAISFGRPFAIAQEDCSGDALDPPLDSPNPTPSDLKDINTGLEAGVRGINFMTIVIKKIYQERKFSTKVAQELSDLCKIYPRKLPRSLHWRRASPNNRRQAMTILHVNTLYCFSVILFTRPFFVHILRTEMQRIYLATPEEQQVTFNKMEKYSEACTIAALHMIALIQNAYDGGYLPRRDPFAITGLFTASIVMLSGKFAPRMTHPSSNSSIDSATAILNYCAQEDPQAAKMSQICDEFKQVLSGGAGGQQLPPSSVSEKANDTTPNPFLDAAMSLPQSGSQDFSHSVEPLLPMSSATLGGWELDDREPTASAPGFPLLPDLPASSDCFSGLPDLEDAIFTTASEDSSQCFDEQIDLDTLWQWPGAYPSSLGSPEFQRMGVDDINKSAVPMFRTMNTPEHF